MTYLLLALLDPVGLDPYSIDIWPVTINILFLVASSNRVVFQQTLVERLFV